MDIRMPEMDGRTATRRNADDPDLAGVKVLVLTTFELDEYIKVQLPIVSYVLASEASGCCAQYAVAKGDRGDHVWLLRVLAQPGGMIDSMVSSSCAPIPNRGWGIASMARAAGALGALFVESLST